jgi:hypothetical protein
MYNYNYCKFQYALQRLSKIFYDAYIKISSEELILNDKHNIYFRLDNVESDLQFDCKLLEYLSRPACKGIPDKDQKFILEKLNKYFEQKWTKEDMEKIYTYLGNGVNRKKTMDFIISNFNFKILEGKK